MSNEGLKLTTTGRSQVDEVPYGTYVYRCADGEFLGDEEGRLMCYFGTKNDRNAIKAMKDAARSYGFTDGEVVFWSGQRPVSDEQYEEQLARQRAGLIPDPLDYGAIMDELKSKKKYG